MAALAIVVVLGVEDAVEIKSNDYNRTLTSHPYNSSYMIEVYESSNP